MDFPSHHTVLPVLPWGPCIMVPLCGGSNPTKWNFGKQNHKDGSKNKGMAKMQICWCSFPADSCTPANAGPRQMCSVIPLLSPESVSEGSLWYSLWVWSKYMLSRTPKQENQKPKLRKLRYQSSQRYFWWIAFKVLHACFLCLHVWFGSLLLFLLLLSFFFFEGYTCSTWKC